MLPDVHLLDLAKLASHNDARSTLQGLLESCVDVTGATSGSILLLRLSESAYVETVVFPSSGREPRRVMLESRGFDADPLLRSAIRHRSLMNSPPAGHFAVPRAFPESRLLVPMSQDDVCTGVMELRKPLPARFNRQHEDILRFASHLALMLNEKEYTLNLLATLHKPITYDQPHDVFLDEIMLQVADAARMPYIVLRRLSGESLRCYKTYGIDLDLGDLDIDSIASNPPFQRAVRQRVPQVETEVYQDYAQRLLRRLQLQDRVKSFIVVPILLGDDVYGTLSFAVACPHSYTTLEKHGLTMVANAVGVALANYENFHKAQERVFEEAKISTAITAVDVAQSARHEAWNLLQNSQELLGVLRTLKITPPKLHTQIAELAAALSERLYGVDTELQKIKAVTKAPARTTGRYRLNALWNEAFAPVAGRLKRLDVSHTVRGIGFATVAADYIRHAFLNLILNSIDAFRESKRKRGRTITVTIDEQSSKAKDNVITYDDNATGIDPHSLGPVLADSQLGVVAIFQSGVTSKGYGSGYGLYLTRKILTEHRGSIDLVSHTGGVRFKITIPKTDRG